MKEIALCRTHRIALCAWIRRGRAAIRRCYKASARCRTWCFCSDTASWASSTPRYPWRQPRSPRSRRARDRCRSAIASSRSCWPRRRRRRRHPRHRRRHDRRRCPCLPRSGPEATAPAAWRPKTFHGGDPAFRSSFPLVLSRNRPNTRPGISTWKIDRMCLFPRCRVIDRCTSSVYWNENGRTSKCNLWNEWFISARSKPELFMIAPYAYLLILFRFFFNTKFYDTSTINTSICSTFVECNAFYCILYYDWIEIWKTWALNAYIIFSECRIDRIYAAI